MSPLHRDGAGAPAVAPTWESLADRLIREAQERGELEAGAWAGRRLPAQDGAYEDPAAAANAILRTAGVAPGWISIDREVRRLADERARLLEVAGRAGLLGCSALRRRFEGVVADLDRALFRLEIEAPTPAQQRPRIDPAADLAAFDRAATAARVPSHAGGSTG